MVSRRSIFTIAVLLGVMMASGLWLYKFYHTVPVGPGDTEAHELGFTSSKRYSDIMMLVHNAKPRQDFSEVQYALVEDVLSSTTDSVKAKIAAVASLMTIKSSPQRARAIDIMAKHTGIHSAIDNFYRSIMETYCAEGSRDVVEKAANGSSPIAPIAKQSLVLAAEQQARIGASKAKKAP